MSGGKIYNFKTYKDAIKVYGSIENYRETMKRIEQVREEMTEYVSKASKDGRQAERAKAYREINDPAYLDFLFDGDFDWSDYQ